MNKARVILFILLCAVIAGLLLYAFRDSISAEMNNLNLIPKPETFTELYFDNSLTLPKTETAKQPITFSFTIHNLEGVQTVYPYSVYFEYTNGDRIVFQSSTVTLNDGETRSITASHTFTASNLQGKVVVDLTDLNQQIDFLLPNTNP